MSTLKIELTEKDVREAIANYAMNTMTHICTGLHADDVKLQVGRQYEDRPGGTHTQVFQKAIITINQS